jgi:enoyl-CoA hydratase
MSENTVVLSSANDPGIAIVRFNRPQAANAMTPDMMRAFRQTLDDIAADDKIRVVILLGEGRGFCSGLDLKSLSSRNEGRAQTLDRVELQELFGSCPLKMRRMRQPIIAAVGGAAIGAGLAIALAADIRVATSTARFAIGAIKIGLSAGETGISYHLPRLVGASRAFDLMLTGRMLDAEEAAAIGLVSEVTDPPLLLTRAVAKAKLIMANSPYGVRQTKQVMWSNLDAPSLDAAIQLENQVQVVSMLTDDFNEGAAAFAEKRPPIFTGN